MDVKKGKAEYSSSQWDHTLLPATRQRWHCRLYPSQ